uniref:Uncharacterized protein n=1 Tax=Arundo donax TaxID=35708 RepID=A0A0A8ZJJ1_ARUDO
MEGQDQFTNFAHPTAVISRLLILHQCHGTPLLRRPNQATDHRAPSREPVQRKKL